MKLHGSGLLAALLLGFVSSNTHAGAIGPARLLLSEVFYDAPGGDNGLEWVELFNATVDPIDLGGWSLGYGGSSYASALLALQGVVRAGEYFVVGGPASQASNANPVFDFAVDFDPGLQNSGSVADGVALFDIVLGDIDAMTLPHDAVIYGEVNVNGLLDSSGAAGRVDVGDVSSGQSIERTFAGWRTNVAPQPGFGQLDVVGVSEPSAVALMLGAMLLLQVWRVALPTALRSQSATGGSASGDAGRFS